LTSNAGFFVHRIWHLSCSPTTAGERSKRPASAREAAIAMNELETFLTSWEREAGSTLKVLKALPATQYDFRPDPGADR
jgi:hypothetical protein